MVAALTFTLVGCGESGKSETGDGYKIENEKLVNKDGDAYISGYITNTTDAEDTILISWYAYDSGKNGIGTAEFKANQIGSNEKYDFEVPFLDSKGNNIRYDSVKQFLLGEVHLANVEEQERLDNVGQKEKGDGFTVKNEELIKGVLNEPLIRGKFVNESGKDLNKVHLVWTLHDIGGAQLGTVKAYIDEPVKAGETIEFESLITQATLTNGKPKDGDVDYNEVKKFKLDLNETVIE